MHLEQKPAALCSQGSIKTIQHVHQKEKADATDQTMLGRATGQGDPKGQREVEVIFLLWEKALSPQTQRDNEAGEMSFGKSVLCTTGFF